MAKFFEEIPEDVQAREANYNEQQSSEELNKRVDELQKEVNEHLNKD